MRNLASIEESCEGQKLFEDTIIVRSIALNLRSLREPGRHGSAPTAAYFTIIVFLFQDYNFLKSRNLVTTYAQPREYRRVLRRAETLRGHYHCPALSLTALSLSIYLSCASWAATRGRTLRMIILIPLHPVTAPLAPGIFCVGAAGLLGCAGQAR